MSAFDGDPPSLSSDVERRRAGGIAQLLVQVARRVLEKRDAEDLHAVQWSALRYFSRAGRRAATVMGLANYLGNTTGSASRTVKSLNERGLIVGTPLREDARSITFKLTKKGEQALGQDPLNEIAEAVSVLDQDELTALGITLDRIRAEIEDRRR